MKIKVRATLIEMFQRIISINEDKEGKVYWNGEDNLYPYEIEGVISNSPTAVRASKILGKFISGKGLTREEQDVIVNPKKNYKLSRLAYIKAQSFSKQGGSWDHIGYGLTDDLLSVIPKTLDILDYPKCRFEKEDDSGNKGMIVYKDFKEKKSTFGKSKKEIKFYPFNKDPDVVIAQIKADYLDRNPDADLDTVTLQEMLPYYRGQVFYDNLTPEYKYALSPFDAVYNHCDTEYRLGLYTNEQWRSGLIGKIAVLTQGLDEETAKKIQEDVANWLGAGNSQGVYQLDVAQTDNLDNVLKIVRVDAQFNEKLFTETKNWLEKSILGQANNLPTVLFIAGDGALFGTSGEMYEQAKLFYSEQTEDERWHLSETLTYLGFPCEIEPMVKKETEVVVTGDTQQNVSEETLQAQATLKGSVGGVQGILGIQQSVSQGLTDFESAMSILTLIYGFTKNEASALLGQPEIQEENADTRGL